MSDKEKKGGGHGKSTKLPKKACRQRSWTRCHITSGGGKPSKKDRNVLRSSHGHFSSVARLEWYRRDIRHLSPYVPRQPYKATVGLAH